MKKTVMITQPMALKTPEENKRITDNAVAVLKEKGFEVLSNPCQCDYSEERIPQDDSVKNLALFFVSQSILTISKCDAVYFCKGWEAIRRCRFEHEAAKSYGIEILYEK